jgi:hypothetical protein
VPGEIHRRRPGEVQQTALARAIADVAGLALVPGRGHDHDDAAGRPALDHEPRHVLGAQESPGEVDRELAVPALERHLQHAQAAEDAGVVDQDVHGAVGIAGPHDHRLDLDLVGDVARDRQRVAATPSDPVRALLGVAGVHVDAHHPGALVGQPPGEPAADVRTRPGHDRHFPREPHACAPLSSVPGEADDYIPAPLTRSISGIRRRVRGDELLIGRRAAGRAYRRTSSRAFSCR